MSSEEHTGLLTDRELLVRIDTRLQAVIEDKKDHETRIRTLEQAKGLLEEKINKAVTGKQLWVGAGSAVATATGAVTLITWAVGR
jgi:hypothetical protein